MTQYTKQWIIETVNSLNPSLVIDAGCGTNHYKAHIANLVGFDPNDPVHADRVDTIQSAQFDPASADAVLALGSMQFGTRESVRADLERVVSWLKPQGLLFMRVKSSQGLDRMWNKLTYNHQPRYCWTQQDQTEWGSQMGLVLEPMPSLLDQDPVKWRWVWRKR